MIYALKSEVRKLLSVRSTYILTVVALALIFLFSYFGTNSFSYEEATCRETGEVLYSAEYSDPRLENVRPEELCEGEIDYETHAAAELPKERLLYGLQEAVPVMVTFSTIVLILMVAHEFRYNMINHSLTISNSRTKVLLAKLIVGVAFTIFTTLLAIGTAVGTIYLAVDMKNFVLPPQDYDWLQVIVRHVTYALGYSIFFMGIAVLVRNLTAGIAAAFVLPTIDGLAGFLLSTRNIEPTRVMPFTALDRFASVAGDLSGGTGEIGERFLNASDKLPPTALGALAVFGAYLIGLWVITWILFLRRDAN